MSINKKGFTLIELLAVIVILAIIAVIATPIITGIIEDSKKASFERSAEGVVEATKFDIPEKLTDSGYTYEFENGEIDLGENVKVNNAKNLSGIIKYNKDGEASYAIHNEKWCVVKNNGKTTTTEYNGECQILTETDLKAFTYKVETKTSYVAGENCVNYFKSSNTEEWAIKFCNNEIVDSNGLDLNKYVNVHSIMQDIDLDTFISDKIVSVLTTEFIEITDYDVSIGGIDVVIPSTINDLEVKFIGPSAFANKQLKSVVIPNSVTFIKDYAFMGNKLTNVKMPSGLEGIGRGIFNDNQLPDDQAFIYSLDGIDDNGVQIIDETRLVSYGGANKDNVVIPNNVIYITISAFENCNINGVTIPDSVIAIHTRAFQNNKLTDIEIPNTVVTIDEQAFNNNLLPDEKAFIYNRTDSNQDGIAEIDNSNLIGYGGKNRENVVIPDTVTTISTVALADNQLISVTIPESVTYIGNSAFANNKLTTITIPKNVTSIDYAALNGNDNLTKIINKTNNSFAWNNILDGKYSDDYNFVTGTVVTSRGNVEVVSE